ncbi:hypothetical protein, partial [Salinivibrio sp. VYel4]|uniref:hypothetical protein n=1 Tax=Salinivibrio sp. VYel4 TaxID=2490491 RepID=UPI00128BB03C
MKVMYLTWGETPRDIGVFRTQVLTMFREISEEETVSSAVFVSAVPLINSFLKREKLGFLKTIRNVKLLLGNIKFIFIPIILPQNYVHSTDKTFKFLHFGTKFFLKKIVKNFEPDVVHCRSYHAAYAAVSLK